MEVKGGKRQIINPRPGDALPFSTALLDDNKPNEQSRPFAPFPAIDPARADCRKSIHTRLATWLDGQSEGHDINAQTIWALIERDFADSDTGASFAREFLKPLAHVSAGIECWLKRANATERPLTAIELGELAQHLACRFIPDLTHLAIHDHDKDRYHVPLYEEGFLTINLHCWEPGEWTSDHDHGNAAGGICVARGEVHEEVYEHGSWHPFVRSEKEPFTFDQCIHRMGLSHTQCLDEYPISVHAYSGPDGGLVQVTSYEQGPGATLSPVRVWKRGQGNSQGRGCPCMFASICAGDEVTP